MTEQGGAEAVLGLQARSSTAVGYHPLFGTHNDLLLLEVDPKLLPDVLHQRVTLRGLPDDDAVLCTHSKTYAIKFVATSNSVFLIPPSALFQTPPGCDAEVRDSQLLAPVITLTPGNMELTEAYPRLDKLRFLLSQNPYKSPDDAVDMDLDMANNIAGLYRWDDLINVVQASDGELRSALQALSAVEIDGYWRIVDEKYMDLILRMLLHNVVLNDWSVDSLDDNEVVGVLASDGFPHRLVRHCLSVYGNEVDSGAGTGSMWKLDDRRVCMHFARDILRGGKMRMETFMGEWMKKVPDGMQASFDMLEGEVLTEKLGVETWVRAFSVSTLPATPAERFSLLFKERSKWERKDLHPYIRDLKVPGLSSEALLLKYARRTQPSADAEPIFSAR